MVCDSSASLSLAYSELSIDTKKRDEKMKNLDPKKKEQMERLGMGGSGVRQVKPLCCVSVISRKNDRVINQNV